jgi:processive 1,2-diacylglycerol beta-glucosyltransferase
VTGIPIHPVFAQEADRATCLKAQGLTGDRPILLQLAGGLGVGPIARIYQNLLALEMPVEVAVVAGKNAAVREELEKIAVPRRHRARIFGFTEQIDQLMAVADVVVSKPGGLTTSEVLARGAAMAVVNPIPGQESRNSDFLLENGAAIKINNLAILPHKLGLLLHDPQRLADMKTNAKRLGRPQAAVEICRLALRLAGLEGGTVPPQWKGSVGHSNGSPPLTGQAVCPVQQNSL